MSRPAASGSSTTRRVATPAPSSTPGRSEPRSFGGAIQGFSVALSQNWVFDRRWGLLVAKRFYSNRPPGILDVPHEQPMKWGAADLPDPFNPLGAKGIGEAAQGRGLGGGDERHRRRAGPERRPLPVAGDPGT